MKPKAILHSAISHILQLTIDSGKKIFNPLMKFNDNFDKDGSQASYPIPDFLHQSRSQNAAFVDYIRTKLAENKFVGHRHVVAYDMQAGKTEMMMLLAYLCHMQGIKLDWYVIVWHEQKSIIAQIRNKFKANFKYLLRSADIDNEETFFSTDYLEQHIISRNAASKLVDMAETVSETIFMMDEDDFAADTGRMRDGIESGTPQTQAVFIENLTANFDKRNNTLIFFSATNPVRVQAARNDILNGNKGKWNLFAPALPASYVSIEKMLAKGTFKDCFLMADEGKITKEGKQLIKDFSTNPKNKNKIFFIRERGDNVDSIVRYIDLNFSKVIKFVILDHSSVETDPNKALDSTPNIPIIVIIKNYMSRGTDLEGEIKRRIVIYHNACAVYAVADIQRIRLTGYDVLHPSLAIYANIEYMKDYVKYMNGLRKWYATKDDTYIQNLPYIDSKHLRVDAEGQQKPSMWRHVDVNESHPGK